MSAFSWECLAGSYLFETNVNVSLLVGLTGRSGAALDAAGIHCTEFDEVSTDALEAASGRFLGPLHAKKVDVGDVPEFSIIIPAHNEGPRLPETAARLGEFIDDARLEAEVLFVDDGSTDDTARCLAQLSVGEPRLIQIGYAVNRGKGAAIREGVAAAHGRIIVFMDADLSYPLTHILEARALHEAGTDLAIGARDAGPSDSRRRYGATRRLASWTFNRLVQRALKLGIKDTQCGFKSFRAEVAKPLFEALTIDGFGFDVELLFVARQWGLEIARVPMEMTPSATSSVSIVRHSVEMARDIYAIKRRGRRGEYPERPVSLGPMP